MFTSTLLLALAGLSSFTDASPVAARGGGKRGLAFPKNLNGQEGSKWTQFFSGSSKISWMYNWEAVVDGPPIDLEYVPLLHSNQQWCTQGWFDNVAAAAKRFSVTSLNSFNEPDQCGGGGSCMSVADAVTAHKKFITPLAGKYRIGAPGVTNSDEHDKGIHWLKEFVDQCKDCNFDFVVAHYYAWDKPEDFKKYLTKFHDTFQKPVWLTEFGVTEGDADKFLKEVLPWLDATSWIERYAYHMVAPSTDGNKYLINAAGTGLSSTGQIYASA